MAANDYHVIMLRVLLFLYRRLKGETAQNPETYLNAPSEVFPVEPDYLSRVLADMQDEGLISGYKVTRGWGGVIVLTTVDKIDITHAGIDYLMNNSALAKAKRFLKDLKEITPFT